jgi:serine/threonine protein kinase
MTETRTPPPPPAGHGRFKPPAAGEVYEGFELLEQVGTGTFANVFSARSPTYERHVALKISKEPVTSQETALRALREVRILGSLANPHVVHVYDHGLGADERWYMVMELLYGEALSTSHDFDLPMTPREAVRIVHQACLGLDEAHRAGVVHRDVKPDNLWLMPDGTVKVLDFGLARAWEGGSTIAMSATVGHMLIGTPHYAQPEQVQAGQLTPASDVYSLGMILYELLVGRTPLFADELCSAARTRLKDEPLKWLIAHVKQPFIPIDHYAEGKALPRKLVETVHRTLAKRPGDRQPNAGALARELAWVLHGDLGGIPAALLHVTPPGGQRRRHIVLPGVHRVGLGASCDIRIAEDGGDITYAIIEWTGAPSEAEIEPLQHDGSLRINGHVLDYRVRLVPGTELRMGDFHLELTYPQVKGA